MTAVSGYIGYMLPTIFLEVPSNYSCILQIPPSVMTAREIFSLHHHPVSMTPTAYANKLYIQHLWNNTSGKFEKSQQLLNQTKRCETSKTPGGNLVQVYKIEARRFVTAGLLLQDNYTLK